jgi:RNA polymerase sigma-70 factor (ECF subfamily)
MDLVTGAGPPALPAHGPGMILDPDQLAACVARTQAGDGAAAERLVAHLQPLVQRIVRAHRPQRLGEDDLAQEVFLKVLDRIDCYQVVPGIPIDHWVARLAVRTCLDQLRAERRRPELRWSEVSEGARAWLDFLGARRDPPDGPAAAAKELVELLFARLPPADRLVLTLLDLEGRPVAEIARLTGWSATLVKVRAFRARRRLRALAGPLTPEDA